MFLLSGASLSCGVLFSTLNKHIGRASRLLVLCLLGALVATAAVAQPGGPLPSPLPLFPADNWWNVDVSAAPADAGSAGFINFIGGNVGLHPDFGGDADSFPDIYGMVYLSVPGSQPLVTVATMTTRFANCSRSDRCNN